jgi:phospholipid transport system substrate-binding protein
LLQSYIPKFKNYTNQKFEIKRILDQSEDEYLVETQIVNENQKPIRVDYKVRKISDDNYRVFDVIAEGISLITTQRSEFGSILSRDGVDALIGKLKIKVESSS